VRTKVGNGEEERDWGKGRIDKGGRRERQGECSILHPRLFNILTYSVTRSLTTLFVCQSIPRNKLSCDNKSHANSKEHNRMWCVLCCVVLCCVVLCGVESTHSTEK
jgi:hypothetical protein